MYLLRVKDRGRDLTIHKLETREEAAELNRVYELLGYPREKIVIERGEETTERAA